MILVKIRFWVLVFTEKNKVAKNEITVIRRSAIENTPPVPKPRQITPVDVRKPKIVAGFIRKEAISRFEVVPGLKGCCDTNLVLFNLLHIIRISVINYDKSQIGFLKNLSK